MRWEVNATARRKDFRPILLGIGERHSLRLNIAEKRGQKIGTRLYSNAPLKDVAKMLGYSNKELAEYETIEREAFNNFTAPARLQRLNHIQTFGFGKFDIQILHEAGFPEENLYGGETVDPELAFKLLVSTNFYDPLKENAFAWLAFFKRTGGVHWG
jgi:hypothetical protein